MPRPEKAAVVEEIRTRLTDADAAVLTEYRGLSVGALAELRSALRPTGAEYKVFKNSLARRGAEAAGRPELLPLLEGPVAFAFVHGDAVVVAKTLRNFSREHEALVLKGGLLGERLLTAAEVQELASIAPRDELLARLAGDLEAPLAKVAGLLGAVTRDLARGLQAYVERRGAAEAGGGAPDGARGSADVPDAAHEDLDDPADTASDEPAPEGVRGDETDTGE